MRVANIARDQSASRGHRRAERRGMHDRPFRRAHFTHPPPLGFLDKSKQPEAGAHKRLGAGPDGVAVAHVAALPDDHAVAHHEGFGDAHCAADGLEVLLRRVQPVRIEALSFGCGFTSWAQRPIDGHSNGT